MYASLTLEEGAQSEASWQPAGTWPDLGMARTGHGCAVTGGLVVVAGGYSGGSRIKTTEIIDIGARTITFGPEMKNARNSFQLAVLPAPGGDRLLALGGVGSKVRGAEVEELVPGPGGSWQEVTGLQERRADYGAVVVPVELVCV